MTRRDSPKEKNIFYARRKKNPGVLRGYFLRPPRSPKKKQKENLCSRGINGSATCLPGLFFPFPAFTPRSGVPPGNVLCRAKFPMRTLTKFCGGSMPPLKKNEKKKKTRSNTVNNSGKCKKNEKNTSRPPYPRRQYGTTSSFEFV